MPIEFRCPQCGQLLRTPDESAGKQARCPQCKQIAAVPAAAGSPQQPAPAPFAPQSASEPFAPPNPFSEAVPPLGKPVASGPVNPYAAPAFQENILVAEPGSTLVHQRIDMGEILGVCWRICKEDLGQCALAGLVYIAIAVGAGVVGGIIGAIAQGIAQGMNGDSTRVVVAIGGQIISQLISTCAGMWAMLGASAWGLRYLRTRQSNVGEYFRVAPYFLRTLGAIFLLYLMMFAIAAIFVGIPVGVGAAMQSQEVMAIGGIVGGLAALAAIVFLSLKYVLYYFFILDRNAGIVEAFRLSAQYTQDNRLSIFALGMAIGLGGTVFLLCTCYIGIIVYMPFAMMVMCLVYLMATGQATTGEPAPLKKI